MKNYLIANKIPESKIIVENKSTNTFENFLFSKEKIEGMAIQPLKISR